MIPVPVQVEVLALSKKENPPIIINIDKINTADMITKMITNLIKNKIIIEIIMINIREMTIILNTFLINIKTEKITTWIIKSINPDLDLALNKDIRHHIINNLEKMIIYKIKNLFSIPLIKEIIVQTVKLDNTKVIIINIKVVDISENCDIIVYFFSFNF
jgi:hypothetical protein